MRFLDQVNAFCQKIKLLFKCTSKFFLVSRHLTHFGKKCKNHKIWASLCKIPFHSNLLFIVLWKQCLTCSCINGTTKDTVKFKKNNISITYLKNASSSSFLPKHHNNSNYLYICRFQSRNIFLINSINLVVMN